VLPELIRELRQDSELELGLSEMTTLQQVEALKSGRIDIAFGRIRIDDAAIAQQVLREDPLVAVLPKGHPLAGSPLSLAQLAQEPSSTRPTPGPVMPTTYWRCSPSTGMSIRVSQWANELQNRHRPGGGRGDPGAGVGATAAPYRYRVCRFAG
jgi:DNA-binding transcriptional LysR family regulator